jgi:phosphopantetheine--protein transferase-like protein
MKHFDELLRNSALSAFHSTVLWSRAPAPGISVAAITDNIIFDVSDLSTALSRGERDKASAIVDPNEKRHFVFKRCFQRMFVKTVLNWVGPLDGLEIEHQLDRPPNCPHAPDLQLSFSSSGFSAVACASPTRAVGIDVEHHRAIENVGALARRFFTLAEAEMIVGLPSADQNLAFLRLWTAKEAGLKAIGRGIVSGLNSLVLSSEGYRYNLEIIEKFKMSAAWSCVHLTFMPHHTVTVVHSPEKSLHIP